MMSCSFILWASKQESPLIGMTPKIFFWIKNYWWEVIWLKVLLHKIARRSLCFVQNFCPSLNKIFIFHAEIAVSFNYDVDNYTRQAMFPNYKDLSMIMKYCTIIWLHNWIHGDEHQPCHLLGLSDVVLHKGPHSSWLGEEKRADLRVLSRRKTIWQRNLGCDYAMSERW